MFIERFINKWRIYEKISELMPEAYDFNGKLPLKQAIPLGLQHVMAMFVGNLTPLLL